MNERIKEIAQEAKLLTGWPVGHAEYQKFAELIIAECIDICIEGNATQMTSNGAAQFIKLRFGIE
jgi:hypothetical protein